MFNSKKYSKDFWGLVSANMFFWMSVNFFLPILPIYYHKLGMNDHQVGIAVGVFSLGSVLFRLLAGKAVDNFGSKPVILVGVIFSIIAMMGYYFSKTLLPTVLMRFIHGAAISGYSAAALTMVTLMHDKNQVAKAVAVFTLFTMIGMGFATSSATWLFLRGDFLLVIGAGVLATFLSLILYPKNPSCEFQPTKGEKASFINVAFLPGVIIPMVTLLAVNICFSSIMTFLPLFMLSKGYTNYGLFYIAYATAIIISRIWIGKLLEWRKPEKLAFYVLALLALTMLTAGSIDAEFILIICGAGIGIGYGLAFPAMATTVTASTDPANRGTAFGFFTMAVDFGFAAGAIAMGLVAEVWGYQAVFVCTGFYTLLYAILYRTRLLRSIAVNRI